MREKRSQFGSKLGMIAAAAGSAVGLGNIWRFPSETADGGGAIFILVYIFCILLFGVPLMVAEFLLGRSSRANAAGAFHKLAAGTQWKWVGRVGVLSGFVILGFYMVVCGWTLDYFFQSITGNIVNATDFGAHFSSLLDNKIKQILLMLVFLLLTAYFIYAGVQKGIESSAKVMMPLLFLLLIVMSIRAMTLNGAGEGLAFLFKPNLAEVKSTVFIDAMGQAFFSLSLGMGCMLTYASYFNKETNLIKTSIQVSILDTIVALMAGIIIFSSAFALTNNTDTIVSELVAGGPGLLFITIPDLFNQMPGSAIWSSLFFLLLAIAALTSTISLMEVVTAYLLEEYKMTRKRALQYIVSGVFVLGVFSAISSGFFNFLDIISAKFMMPIGGLFISLFVGWYLDKKIIQVEITNDGSLRFGIGFLKAYSFILKFLAPAGILVIFLYGLLG
ncbi:MAG: sodium-dependent transporter [Proteiniphilum sp.]|nr:sodium-dependent transporter [Proteiniphilum sp.]